MKEIRLIKGKFMLNGELYVAGEVLPDTKSTRALIKAKKAAEVDVDDGDGESYKDLSVRVLVEKIKERGIEIPSGTKKKDDFIALLEKWDAEHGASDDAS